MQLIPKKAVWRGILVLLPILLLILLLLPTKRQSFMALATETVNVEQSKVSLKNREEIRNTNYIQSFRYYSWQVPFIRYNDNYIAFQQPATELAILKALAEADRRKVSILHIGDSHIQADIYTGAIRIKMQEAFGNAGRGMIFPYRTARTNSPDDYTTLTTGLWQTAKVVNSANTLNLGLAGYSVSTLSAESKLTFDFRNPTGKALGNRIKVLCQKDAESFDIEISSPQFTEKVKAEVATNSGLSFVQIDLPAAITSQFTLSLVQSKPTQKRFICYGMVLENIDSVGVLYHQAGANGAKVLNYLSAPLLAEQVTALQPDMVVLDIGVNDYYTSPCIPVYLQDSLQALLGIVQKAAPNASIVLTSQQPNTLRNRPVMPASAFSKLVVDMGLKTGDNIGVYDFYRVTNTRNSVLNWRKANLMQKDGIHLTHTGYRHKAELFTNALLGAYQMFLQGESSTKPNKAARVQQLIAGKSVDAGKVRLSSISEATGANSNEQDAGVEAESNFNAEDEANQLSETIALVPEPGAAIASSSDKKASKNKADKQMEAQEEEETLSSDPPLANIPQSANPYGYKVGSKKWKEAQKKERAAKNKKKATRETKQKNQVVGSHTIQSGETLISIAKQYRTTVTAIKQANGIKGSSIKAGDKIKIVK